jgi:shikimate kinase
MTTTVPTKTNLFLIGPYGVGKRAVGRELARHLKRTFYDTDIVVEKRTGVDKSWIFDVEGEMGFREREQEALRELAKLSHCVIATGGGTILQPENRQLMHHFGHVIYLVTDLSNQLERTARNRYRRPLLRVDNLQQRIVRLNEERAPLYEEIADATFTTTHLPLKNITKAIADYVKEAGW